MENSALISLGTTLIKLIFPLTTNHKVESCQSLSHRRATAGSQRLLFCRPHEYMLVKRMNALGTVDAWIDSQGIVDVSDSVSRKVHFFYAREIMQGWSGFIIRASAAHWGNTILMDTWVVLESQRTSVSSTLPSQDKAPVRKTPH